jgi:hypothetical protein
MKIRTLIVIFTCVVLLFAGCSQKVQDKKEPEAVPLKPEAAHSAGQEAVQEKPAELKFTAPPEWMAETPSSASRKAQYKLPRAVGDSEDAQLVVYYFGGGGGTPQANIDRWIGEFTGSDGKPVSDAKILRKTANGIALTTVDVRGSYATSMGMMGQSGKPKAGSRLLGAIAETGNGPWFFKLIGPEKTVAKWQPGFDALLNSIRQSE